MLLTGTDNDYENNSDNDKGDITDRMANNAIIKTSYYYCIDATNERIRFNGQRP